MGKNQFSSLQSFNERHAKKINVKVIANNYLNEDRDLMEKGNAV